MSHLDAELRHRIGGDEPSRDNDDRDEYQRDRARIIHSAAFRRLQAKTQVMGVGEGDFHRTRLTHSLEVAQIGEGIRNHLRQKHASDDDILNWLPTPDLICAACYAHDLGHPPYGHGGEVALQELMCDEGGFEGNAQTLRILTRLEHYSESFGINPTKRLVLAVLKYPVSYETFYNANKGEYANHPPKCYYGSEEPFVSEALQPLFQGKETEQQVFLERDYKKAKHRTLDATIMECADDIAYGVHDLEDIVGRKIVSRDDLADSLRKVLGEHWKYGLGDSAITENEFLDTLFRGGFHRKSMIGKLVHLFIISTQITPDERFTHPLARYRCVVDSAVVGFLDALKAFTYEAVISRPGVQQLERRGKRVVSSVFEELSSSPGKLIPRGAWESTAWETNPRRRVCDYVSGMTDPFCEKIYRRFFVPGIGSSTDEL